MFLRAAADKGLLDMIGARVQALAFAATASWRSVMRERPPRIAVNLGAGEIAGGGFAARLLDRLALAGLAPHALELDLAAAGVPQFDGDAVVELQWLQAAGVAVALDDCADLEQMRCARAVLALDRVEIDLRVVRDVHLDPNRQATLRRLVDAARESGIGVVAEGVETTDEAAYLAQAGCGEAQGYCFGRPEVI